MDEITVHSPATVANVVCGFDCLGFALSEPFDVMTLRKIEQKTIRIKHHDDFGLPVEPGKNVAGAVLGSILETIDADFGFEIEITKRIKPGSGIGSSAASAAGAAVAANILLGDRFSKSELVEFARNGEAVACGSRIADNVSACIFGGFTLVRATEPIADVISLDHPTLFAAVIHPQIEIKTADARAVMPREFPLTTAVRQWGNVGALVAGLAKGDYDLIARSLEDFVAEPYRKNLIPHYDELKTAGLQAGALGGGISGSGPSVFMLARTREIAGNVVNAMNRVYDKTEIAVNCYVSDVEKNGVRIARDVIHGQ